MERTTGSEGRGRTVLVLTYRWPPQGGGGVQRTLKLVKYLAGLGWRPVVHTVANPYSRLWDPTLASEIPESAVVYKTPTVEYESLRLGAANLAGRALRALRGGKSEKGSSKSAGGGSKAPPAAAASLDEVGTRESRRQAGLAGRVEDWIWSRLLIPDPQIVWSAAAFVRSLAIAQKENPAVVYSSSPPNSLNVMALALARRLHLPWIADMRDPWTDGLRRRQWYPDHPGRQRREERWERQIFENATNVLVTTDPARQTFLDKYPWCPPERVRVLTNAFDPADFAQVSSERRLLEPGHLHLSLSGNVETMFDLGPFLVAVRGLIDADPAAREFLRVNFLGTKRQLRYDEAIEKLGIGDVVRFHAYMPHERVVQLVSESDALMLCQIPAQESGGVKLPGKMFEYLFTRKPILALTIPGATQEILDRAGVGRVVDPNDVAGIRAELSRFVDEYRHGGIRAVANEAVIESFDRSAQARVVSDLLSEAIAEGPRRG
ncbi:MAG: glycosyltransferase family 4 protein [Deltaproteobacteria bacterium]|nr:glycosyltransferase family 4 protein [Deltaproteobacteria bacterium]